MKVVILAGGLGTRISEESHIKPKPMIEIGENPIMVHIMRIYAAHNFKDFVICAGYKQRVIKEYFSNFNIYTNDVTFDFSTGERIVHKAPKFDWKVTVADTGLKTQTAGRILRAKDYIGNETFMLTYGDAVGDINIQKVLEEHKKSEKLCTICVYNSKQNKGIVELSSDGLVKSFREKSDDDGELINIGFMVCEPQIFDYITGDDCVLEKDVLPKLAAENQLNSYVHRGFWQCMDTLREKNMLEELNASSNCPWKIWKK